jgi:plasmid stabilization system protein ParE
MAEVKLTDRAYQQLKGSAQWWADNRSFVQAVKWYEGFLRALVTLEKNPERCPLARENESMPVEMRELHFGLGRHKTHRAVFTIRPDYVVVYAIRHLAADDLSPDDI